MKKRTSSNDMTGEKSGGTAGRSKRLAPTRSKGRAAPPAGDSAVRSETTKAGEARAKATARRSTGKPASSAGRSAGGRSSSTSAARVKKPEPAIVDPKDTESPETPPKVLNRPAPPGPTRDEKTETEAPPEAASPPATSQDPIQFPEQQQRKVKTYLSAKELREFKELLLEKRAELAGDVQRLTSEALNRERHGEGDHSSMPIHMADLGSDNWEQDFTLGLIANEEALVREIDDALARIEDRTYGICMATQNRISVARLRAKPWAKYCIEYARAREEGRAP